MKSAENNFVIDRRQSRSLAERLWERVDKSAGKEGCWIWLGGTVRGRYGQIRLSPSGGALRGRKTTTHRAAWELSFGPIPSMMHVCHRCDNPRCVNPQHLWVGTHSENLADMKAKGRAARGERSGTARLTQTQVRAIRKALQANIYSLSELAELNGVSRSTIDNIKHQRTWEFLDAGL
jgi:hypothetical protein